MTERIIADVPRQTCQLCGTSVVVERSGRGFPPDVAKRTLRKLCAAAGCPCEPKYTAGYALQVPINDDGGAS